MRWQSKSLPPDSRQVHRTWLSFPLILLCTVGYVCFLLGLGLVGAVIGLVERYALWRNVARTRKLWKASQKNQPQ
jgi:hypothetical protein